MAILSTRRRFLSHASILAGALLHGNLRAADSKKLVLLAGRPSHGPMEHEFNAGVMLIQKLLAKTPALNVVVHRNGWPADESLFDNADGILLFSDGGGGHPFIQANHLQVIDGLMKKGVGLMLAHFAVEVPKDKGGKELQEWIGGHYEHLWSCNPHWTPEFKEIVKHPITAGVKPFAVKDEWYFNMRFRQMSKDVTPILAAVPADSVRKGPYAYPKGPYDHIVAASGRPETVMWAVERTDGGRGVGFTGGHYHRNWIEPNYRKVFLNALLWICKAPIPEGGVESTVTESDLRDNLDPKPQRRK